MGRSVGVGIETGGLVASQKGVPDGLFLLIALGIMMRENGGLVLAPELLHAAPDSAVQSLPPRPQQAAIRDPHDDGVLEAIFEVRLQACLMDQLDTLQDLEVAG